MSTVLDPSHRPEAATAPTRPWARVFAWCVRRELWENPAIVLGPLALEAVVVIPYLLSTGRLPATLRRVQAGDAKAAESLWAAPSAAALAPLVMGLLVAVLYCLSALHNERRDRSLLFWKSLPVSDSAAVLSKAFVPLAVIPAVSLAVAMATHVAMLAWGTLVSLVAGIDPQVFWSHQDMGLMWIALSYGLALNALWMAPLFALLLLISAWAPRSPTIWALGLLAAPPIIERAALNSTHIWDFESRRLFGAFAEAFSQGGKGKAPLEKVSDIDPVRTLGLPDIWVGLIVAAVFLAAAIWLRRRREPA